MTRNAFLQQKTLYETEFSETPNNSCFCFKFYQFVQVYDSFAKFSYQYQIRAQYLEIAKDLEDDLIYIIEVVWKEKKTILARSVILQQYPVASHSLSKS